ncbi:MAG: hypothetical protein NTY07_17530 [Bacteroidia bacterium]|nr:hypothetical protein [Bacteroidia bacterium]
MEYPPVLVQQNPRLSLTEAKKNVDDLLATLGIQLFKNPKDKQYILKHAGTDHETKIQYINLIRQIREDGVCEIQADLDRTDIVFGGTFGMAFSGMPAKSTIEWAGYKKELIAPFRNECCEIDLSNDIEFYKEETCNESVNHDFEMCARNFRGYLFSSIALIDAYINRHIIFYKFQGLDSEIFNKLLDCRITELRVELFINEFCHFEFEVFKQSKDWSDFKRLKELRNETVHALTPYFGISLREVANNLNLSINGVGGFLKKMQEGQNRRTLGFIEKVRTSPAVHFNHVTLRENGSHHVKNVFNRINRS